MHHAHGRVFVLVTVTAPVLFNTEVARVYDVDPVDGAVTPRGGTRTMSAVYGRAAPDGTLPTVAFARVQSPQVVGVTRFDPRTGAITQDEIVCDAPACELSGFSSFLSGDKRTSRKPLRSLLGFTPGYIGPASADSS